MCRFIGIECVVANALIELLEKQDCREVSFETLVNYGMKVAHILEEDTGEEIVLLLSKKYQLSLVDDYAEFFDVEFMADGNGLFKLKGEDKNATLDELKSRFRFIMNERILRAFVSAEALNELGVAA